jgi:hypothetical protein
MLSYDQVPTLVVFVALAILFGPALLSWARWLSRNRFKL